MSKTTPQRGEVLLLRLFPEVDYAANAGKPWLAFRRVHIGRGEDVYLQRFILLRCPWGSIYLHRFFRGDEDACLHDHPWAFVSVILRGGYFEETVGGKQRWYRPGSILFRRATHRHRVILSPERKGDVWSLVATTAKVRSWGFWTRGGTIWVPWREFIDGGSQGCE